MLSVGTCNERLGDEGRDAGCPLPSRRRAAGRRARASCPRPLPGTRGGSASRGRILRVSRAARARLAASRERALEPAAAHECDQSEAERHEDGAAEDQEDRDRVVARKACMLRRRARAAGWGGEVVRPDDARPLGARMAERRNRVEAVDPPAVPCRITWPESSYDGNFRPGPRVQQDVEEDVVLPDVDDRPVVELRAARGVTRDR